MVSPKTAFRAPSVGPMRMIHLAALTVLSSQIVTGCASKSQTVYVAPSNHNVYATVEEPLGTPRQRITYVQNRSTVPVVVYSIMLTSCSNVRERCDSPMTTNVVVPAGQRKEILRVQPGTRGGSFTYRMAWRWRPEKGTEATLASIAEGPPASATADSAAAERAETARRAAAALVDKQLQLADINALGPRVAYALVEPDSLRLQVGDTVSLGRIRVRMILFDSTGQRLGRVMTPRWRPRLAGVLVHTPPYLLKAVAPGSAVLEFLLPEEALPERPLRLSPAEFTIVVR